MRDASTAHPPKAVLFDVDGTLVDSNDAHARSWVAAFAEHGITVDFAEVRRRIGMGGDKLMREVSGVTEESPTGTAIAKRRGEIFLGISFRALRPFATLAASSPN
jgi:beta-phosphoglucomutase-like phosphatase (HAD superfamily)